MTSTDTDRSMKKASSFHSYLDLLRTQEQIPHVLEVGASSGVESIEVLTSQDFSKASKTMLHRVDASAESVALMRERFRGNTGLKTYHAASVPRDRFISERDLRRLYVTNLSVLNHHPLSHALEQRERDLLAIKDSHISETGIEMVKTEHGISSFDLAIINGAQFSGLADLEALLGATRIVVTQVNHLIGLRVYDILKLNSNYSLEAEHWGEGLTYAAFRKKQEPTVPHMPLHIFTIVLNGMPFLKHHIEVFSKLSLPWTWHVVEGVATHSHDTAWSLQNGATIKESLHRNGLSIDGTTEYLDALAAQYPDKVKIYRPQPGKFWDGKREMVNAPLSAIGEQALLVQVDSDELWTVEQLERLSRAFAESPEKTAAFFFCHYFVGPELVIGTRNTYGNNSSYEWLRAWRFFPGSRWEAHEPPRLMAPLAGGRMIDLAAIRPFTHAETESMGLVFQHYAYVTEDQARFKESYYGYADAVTHWSKLQRCTDLPALVSSYLPWVKDGAQAVLAASMRIRPLARKTLDGEWHFIARSGPASPVREVLLIRTDMIGDGVLFSSLLPAIKELYPESAISIVCQEAVAPLWENSPLIHRVITFKKAHISADQGALEGFVAGLRNLRPDVAINSTWSSDALAHVLTISSGAPIRICLNGDSANISSAEKERARSMYSLIADSSPQATLEINRYRDLVIALGGEVQSIKPSYEPSESEREEARACIEELGLRRERLLVVVPQAAGGIPHREYPPIVDAVAEATRRHGLDVLVLGTSKDLAIADEIVRRVGEHASSLVGKTSIREAAAILSHAACVLGVDTGLMHLAAAQDVPCVVIMGGGHFGRFFPHGAKTKIVTNRLECFGCNWACTLPKPLCTLGIPPQIIADEVCSLCTTCGIDARPAVAERRVVSALSLL